MQSGTGGAQSGSGGAQIGSGGAAVGSGGSQLGSGGTPIGSGGAQVGSGGAEAGTGGTPTDSGGSGGTPVLQSSDRDPTYAISGPWHGYIWPAVDWQGVATISPTAAEGFRDGGPPFCVEGHVPASSNSTAVAMVGMNANQEQGNGPVAAQWMPTGEGILVNVSNPGGSPLRLQIQTDETGAVAEIWCAMITEFEQDVLVTWAELNTQCWSNTGTWYSDSMAGIATVMVLVPGTAEAGGYAFDFCVNELTPI